MEMDVWQGETGKDVSVCVCAKRSSSELNNDKALQRSGQVAKHLQVQVN